MEYEVENIKHEIFSEDLHFSQLDKWTKNTTSSAKDADRLEQENMECRENVQYANMSNTVIIHCPKNDVQSSCVRKCAACRKSINTESYLSWELMDFCDELCISKIQGLGSSKCVYCSRFINIIAFGKYYVRIGKDLRLFCTKTCFDSYKLKVKFCSHCQKDISGLFSVGLNQIGPNRISFCSQDCYETFNSIIKNNPPKAPPYTKCSVCQRDKSVEIILKHDGITNYFCSKRCLIAYSFVKLQTGTEKCVVCQNYFSRAILENALFYENVQLTFCSNSCQNIYILLYGKIVNCSFCLNKRYNFGMIRKYSKSCQSPNIFLCSVNCLRLYHVSTTNETGKDSTIQEAQTQSTMFEIPPRELSISQTSAGAHSNVHNSTMLPNLHLRSSQNANEITNNSFYLPIQTRQQFLLQSTAKIEQRNVATMCCIPKADKSSLAQPITLNKMTQTDEPNLKEILIPIPFPIHIAVPMAMYSVPVPVAMPFPIPIPVPIFIPTAQKSLEGIMKEIENIHNRIPNDPYEAELLQIADVIAQDKARDDSGSDKENTSDMNDNKCIFGEKLKEIEPITDVDEANLEWESSGINVCEFQKDETGVRKSNRKRRDTNYSLGEAKRERISECEISEIKLVEKTRLNYTLGINAWKQWVKKKNYLLKKSSKNIVKMFETDILQIPSDKLNYALCMFIKELKKPNEFDYAPDTMFYLCLGIQYYLNQNGRNDNIFQDIIYNTFSNELDKLAQKFCALYEDDSHFIVTRVEEEHLWEAKQLGCHSPQVLLNTLIYFNTKYYLTSTVEHHMEISFFQVLKVWKKKAKSKSLMLRFCPKKPKNNAMRVCEQYENEKNHSRCPVKLYEFYLSKCPESAKTRHDLFYLQPEKYCIPDSPLWYTTNSIPKETLAKMINRVKIVKEINVALLSNN